MGAGQMLIVAIVAKKRNFPVEKPTPLRDIPAVTLRAFPALMMPVVLLGGIYGGATTPTEAAAVAAAYAFVISLVLYRSVTVREHLQRAAGERAHDRLDRHADRRRHGVQLHRHRSRTCRAASAPSSAAST